MTDARREPMLQLVRNLVELLAPYEDELISTELTSPDLAFLRRAVSMTIAEACYWISDEGGGRAGAGPCQKGDETRPAR